MTKANYIDWENLKNIPFFLCQVVEDEQNQEIVLYYFGERVFHDYDHVGHYMRSAIVLFRQIRNRTADWVNLRNLWTLRNCIRENYNHGIGVDALIYGENYDGENPETLTPLTKQRFELIIKRSELPTPKGMSFGENSPLSFPASSCHCFLGHEVVHPQEGSPQA